MEKNGLKVSRAKTEHLQTTGDTDPVRMKRYMETEMVNLPTVQSFKYLGSTIDRGGGASKDGDNRVTKAWSKWRELNGVIMSDKKIPTKLKLLIYQTVIRPTLLYGFETWPMSVKDEKSMATTEMRMVRWAMGVSLLEHRRNEEILEEAKVEAIATVMRRRRLEWFGHVKRRGETENIRAVAEMKMEGKRPRGRPKFRWKDTVRRDLTAWKIKEEWATDRERWKGLCKTRYPERTGRRRRKVRKVRKCVRNGARHWDNSDKGYTMPNETKCQKNSCYIWESNKKNKFKDAICNSTEDYIRELALLWIIVYLMLQMQPRKVFVR